MSMWISPGKAINGFIGGLSALAINLAIAPLSLASDTTLADQYHQIHELDAMGKYSEALAEVDKLLAKSSNNKVLLYLHAHEELQLGHYEKALKELSALEPPVGSFAVRLYQDKARAYIFLKRYPEAVKAYDKILQKCDSYCYALTMNNRAVCLLLAKDLNGALRDVSTAIKVLPSHGPAYSNRAEIYYKLGRYKECIADANYALTLFQVKDSSAGACYYWKSLAEKRLGMIGEANKDAQEASRLNYKPDAIELVAPGNIPRTIQQK